MQVLVAPDKFKGSLTASAAAEAVRTGLLQALPDAEVVLAPVADGGDGTVDAAVAAGYEWVPARRLAEASALLGAGSAAADSRTSATAHAAHRQQPD